MSISKTSDHIHIKIKMSNPSQEPPASSKTPNQALEDMDDISSSKSRKSAKIQILGVSKTSDHIQIKINILCPSQEPSVSSKALN